MELKEFINNTLTQIAEGVQEAIDNSDGKGYFVNPSGNKNGCNYTVHFDLCVTSQKEGGLNIKVADGSLSEKSTNRITFDVEMLLPRPESANAAHKRTEKYLDWKKIPWHVKTVMKKKVAPLLGSEPLKYLVCIGSSILPIHSAFQEVPQELAIQSAVLPVAI